MALANRLFSHRGHTHDGSGGHIIRPRLYEIVAAVSFLGRRRAVFDQLVALSGMQGGDRVLDVGCGTGYLTRRAARAVGPAGRVVGVDPSQPVVDHARRVSPSNCDFHVTGGEAVPEPDESFDVVVSSLAIHHIPPDLRPAALAEMHRLLRPGGKLLIAEFRPPRNRILNRLIGHSTGGAMHHNLAEELIGLVTGAGFELTDGGDRGPRLPLLQPVQARRPV